MAGGHVWHGGGHEWQGACMAEGCASWGGGCAWQEKRQLHRAIHILLECILVWQNFSQKLHESERIWTERVCVH